MKNIFLLFAFISIVSCQKNLEKDDSNSIDLDPYQPKEYVKVTHPEWSKNATIYQLNTRQFSEEGTFKAAQTQLPRIKELGVDIIWLMPINPIGKKNRKGTLGSPYSVKDYYGVNPEFGTFQDLKNFVNEAHKLGMYVILDWVANHTAWDNELVEKHPEWYAKDYKGDFRPTPWWDWSDIIDLDYNKSGVRKYMTEALKYWVKEADIDGYRCDVAGFVPLDFWNNVRKELDAIKPIFMLGEWESRDLHAKAFDMTYAWDWNEKLHNICMGKADVNQLYIYYSWNERFFPKNSIRMTFVSNHDKNSWEGTMYEQFGEGLEAAIERTKAYVAAGADGIFAEAVQTEEHYRAFSEALDVPILANITEFGKTELWNKEQLGEWGCDMVLYPLSAFRAMNKAAENVYQHILNDGDQKAVVDTMQTRMDLYDYLGYHDYEQKLDSLFAEGKNK